jgi:plasmid stabilization system protein ParE
MTWRVRLTREAVDDLRRIEDFLMDQALQHGDFTLPLRAEAAIRRELALLQTNPYTCRKAAGDPFERELVIPFGHSGFLALFRILDEREVAVLALRHQREDDWH